MTVRIFELLPHPLLCILLVPAIFCSQMNNLVKHPFCAIILSWCQPDIHSQHVYQLSLNSAFESVRFSNNMEDNNPLIETIKQDSPSRFSKVSERTAVFTTIWRNQILLGFALFVSGNVLFVLLTIIFETGMLLYINVKCSCTWFCRCLLSSFMVLVPWTMLYAFSRL